MGHNKVFIIAEAGVNHNGSLDLAEQLVRAAHVSGADAVKFQTFRTTEVVSTQTPLLSYQSEGGALQSQVDLLSSLELDRASHEHIKRICEHIGIEFMSTPFDVQSLQMLVSLGAKRLKIASGEITNAPLLYAAGHSGLPTILSTGMSVLGEVEEALGVLACGYLREQKLSRRRFLQVLASADTKTLLQEKVTLLHCTSEYPAQLATSNLKSMATLANAFGVPVGFSDHTPGNTAAVVAVALGASVYEKHLTIDCSLPGPDHKASLEPEAFKSLVSQLRDAEASLGDGRKCPTPGESEGREITRRSVVACGEIMPGESFSHENLRTCRPGRGVSPMMYWDLLGRKSLRHYNNGEAIET